MKPVNCPKCDKEVMMLYLVLAEGSGDGSILTLCPLCDESQIKNIERPITPWLVELEKRIKKLEDTK